VLVWLTTRSPEFWLNLFVLSPAKLATIPDMWGPEWATTQVYPAREATLVRASQDQGWSRPSVEVKGFRCR